jgi:hypothetical protein
VEIHPSVQASEQPMRELVRMERERGREEKRLTHCDLVYIIARV